MQPTFWTWATVHWWLAFWLIFWAMWFALHAFGMLFYRLPRLAAQRRNIAKHGWPPAHVDALGEFRPKKT